MVRLTQARLHKSWRRKVKAKFNYALTADKTIIQNTAIVAVGFILAFTALGLITFEKQDL